MEISKTGVPDLNVAVLDGRLDSATAFKIEERLLPLLRQSRVVLDMTGVGFVSSAGLRVLLKAAKAAKSAGTNFAICGLQPIVREVYEVSGFDRLIPHHATRAEAVASLS